MLSPSSIQFQSVIKEYHKKKVAPPKGLPNSGQYQIKEEEKYRHADSFKSIQFPRLQHTRHSSSSLIPEANLEGLSSYLKKVDKKVEGPEVLLPGLLAERKYAHLDFKRDTENHVWNATYPQYKRKDVFSSDSKPRLELMIEARLQGVKELFSFFFQSQRFQ